jgi:hypothetical protein
MTMLITSGIHRRVGRHADDVRHRIDHLLGQRNENLVELDPLCCDARHVEFHLRRPKPDRRNLQLTANNPAATMRSWGHPSSSDFRLATAAEDAA